MPENRNLRQCYSFFQSQLPSRFFWMVSCQCPSVYQSLSRVQFFVILWTITHQILLSMGFSRQEYWSGLPFPSPGDLPNPGIVPTSPELQTFLTTQATREALVFCLPNLYDYLPSRHCYLNVSNPVILIPRIHCSFRIYCSGQPSKPNTGQASWTSSLPYLPNPIDSLSLTFQFHSYWITWVQFLSIFCQNATFQTHSLLLSLPPSHLLFTLWPKWTFWNMYTCSFDSPI